MIVDKYGRDLTIHREREEVVPPKRDVNKFFRSKVVEHISYTEEKVEALKMGGKRSYIRRKGEVRHLLPYQKALDALEELTGIPIRERIEKNVKEKNDRRRGTRRKVLRPVTGVGRKRR